MPTLEGHYRSSILFPVVSPYVKVGGHHSTQYQTLFPICCHGSTFDGRNPAILMFSCNKMIYIVLALCCCMFSSCCVATSRFPSFACYLRLGEPTNSVVPCSNSYEGASSKEAPNLHAHKHMKRYNILPEEV